jgi:phosphoribosylformylglycinamidine synthase
VTAEATKNTIAPGAWREVALSDDEYVRILELIETREPTPVELGMFGSMWSEHCGYKHTRPILGRLPTKADWVLQGPGENAGAIDIGDGLAAVFKVESHNHPSAVEPYEGAATGVGGIVRDIFTMGARPVAILNSLRFGPLDQPRNVYLFENVVAGIGGYGNCLGIPTVGGDVFFDPSYSGNPLVNAMCIGIVDANGIVRAKASGVGNLIMLIGADTGRDGLHGATFASVDDPEASHRGVIQVGNPFLEKLLLEACLELLQTGSVVAMQDLGAAGLTSSTVEIASRGGVGAEIDVAKVPRRESGMTPYEVMMSESQERMLLVVTPEAAVEVERIVTNWSLHSAVIGTVTADGMVRVLDDGEIVAEIPAEYYTDACPTYIREAAESPEIIAARATDPRRHQDITKNEIGGILLELLASPNVGSRRPVYEQYDHTIQTNTVVPPGEGDAAVLRIKGTQRGIASAIDCNPRYCYLDPYLGAQHAVAEAGRNVSCSGATPRGATNCLNFGNPQKPAGYFQLERAVSGLADACRALDLPMVGGNVSLYNETASEPIKPNPAVGVVGVLEDVSRHATMRWTSGQQIFLIGNGAPTLGGSEYLSLKFDEVTGTPPTLDLDAESRVQQATRQLIEEGATATAHDLSLGGLAVALAKMAVLSDCGVAIDNAGILDRSNRLDENWFGESASQIIIAIDASARDRFETIMADNDVPFSFIGTTGGTTLELGSVSIDISALRAALDRAFDLPDVPGTA